jgi:hypothetical protein
MEHAEEPTPNRLAVRHANRERKRKQRARDIKLDPTAQFRRTSTDFRPRRSTRTVSVAAKAQSLHVG